MGVHVKSELLCVFIARFVHSNIDEARTIVCIVGQSMCHTELRWPYHAFKHTRVVAVKTAVLFVMSKCKAVQRATLTLQRVHDVHRRDGLWCIAQSLLLARC